MKEAFARVARLACQLTAAPAAVVGIRRDPQGWVQAFHGLRSEHQKRAAGWCALASSCGSTYAVDDASKHPSFRYHSLVAGPPHVRSLVSVPIIDAGEQIGALCVLDTDVRPAPAPRVLAALHDLATMAAHEVELRRTVAALETARAEFEAIFETMPDAIVYVGQLDWSGDALERFDLTSETPDWEELLERVPREAREQYEQAVRRCLDEGASYDLELPLDADDGEHHWLRATGKPRFQNADIVGVTGFVQDITDRKQAEQAKREFISVVSHELRTPLTSIYGALSLLMGGAGGELPEPARPLVSMALRNSERLTNLIDDILDIDKIEAGKLDIHPQLVHAADCVEDVVQANQSYALGYEVGLAARVEDDAQIMIDPDKLEQVLSNLISNAIKFSPPGAQVQVVVRRPDDQTVRIEVIDRGDGIAEDFQAHLFDKFAQADSSDTRRAAGTGLGLAIAKALTEQMGGRIDFVSRVGEGTTMFVDFPAAGRTLAA